MLFRSVQRSSVINLSTMRNYITLSNEIIIIVIVGLKFLKLPLLSSLPHLSANSHTF